MSIDPMNDPRGSAPSMRWRQAAIDTFVEFCDRHSYSTENIRRALQATVAMVVDLLFDDYVQPLQEQVKKLTAVSVQFPLYEIHCGIVRWLSLEEARELYVSVRSSVGKTKIVRAGTVLRMTDSERAYIAGETDVRP